MTAAFAALLAASAPMALAQSTATPSTPHPTATPSPKTAASDRAAMHDAVTANRVMPGQIRMTDMNGATVYDTQNKDIGDIKDVVIDRDGKVAAVVLNVGATLGMGGKLVAVPMSDLKVTADKNNTPRFTVDKTQQELKSAQAFALSNETAKSGSSTRPATTPPARPEK